MLTEKSAAGIYCLLFANIARLQHFIKGYAVSDIVFGKESAACRSPHIFAEVEFLCCGGIQIAVRHRPAANLCGCQTGAGEEQKGMARQRAELFWLGGYRSDMEGTKAQAVDAFAAAHGLAATRFDYSGHGRSGGDFYQGTISLWLAQSLAVFEKFHKSAEKASAAGEAEARPVLTGSSMGGWIALRMAQELQSRGIKLGALVLLAPAPDFTETLIKPAMTELQRQQLREQGFFTVTEEGIETPFSQALLQDGSINRVLQNKKMLQFGCPVYILQGMRDNAVPYRQTMRLMQLLPLDKTSLTLIKDGDHRLSQPKNIDFLYKILETCLNFI